MESEASIAQVILALQEALSQSQEREHQLRAELDLVKQDNLRLAEANLKLQSQLEAPAQPAQIVAQTQAPAKKIFQRTYRPIASNAPLSKVNNQNIGWFD